MTDSQTSVSTVTPRTYAITEQDSRRITALSRFYGIKRVRGPITTQLGPQPLSLDFALVDRGYWQPYWYAHFLRPEELQSRDLYRRARIGLNVLLLVDATDHALARPVYDHRFSHREKRLFRADAIYLARELNADILFEDDAWTTNSDGLWEKRLAR